MAKVILPYNVAVGVGANLHNLKAGEQEVSAEVEKALIDAGIIEASKKVVKKPTVEE